ETRIKLTVDDGKAPTRSQHPYPLVDRRLRVRQCPQHMAADDQVEAAGRERKLLGITLFEADRDVALHRLAPRLGQHRGCEVDAGDTMTATRELEAEEAG